MTPIEEKHSFNWRALILWLLVIPPVYLLSAGPVAMMQLNGCISPRSKFVSQLYAPRGWVYRRTALHKPLGIYMHLWVPGLFNKHGENPP